MTFINIELAQSQLCGIYVCTLCTPYVIFLRVCDGIGHRRIIFITGIGGYCCSDYHVVCLFVVVFIGVIFVIVGVVVVVVVAVVIMVAIVFNELHLTIS